MERFELHALLQVNMPGYAAPLPKWEDLEDKIWTSEDGKYKACIMSAAESVIESDRHVLTKALVIGTPAGIKRADEITLK